MFETFRRFNASNSGYTVQKLKCLSPDGRERCPQGVYIAKGKWHQAARINEDSFIVEENSPEDEGGIILFRADMNQAEQRHKAAAHLKAAFDGKQYIYSIGNFFTGFYPAESGIEFNKKSLSVRISNISSKKLLDIAADLAAELKSHLLLIKDLNKNQFYFLKKK